MKKLISKITFFCCFLMILNLPSKAQKIIQQKENYFLQIELEVQPNTFYENLNFNFPFNSFAITWKELQNPINSYISIENLRFEIEEESHFKNVSELIILENISEQFNFYSGDFSGKIIFNLQFAKPIPHQKPSFSSISGNCPKPPSIPASTWRTGLPNPAPNPSFTKANHVIVHHSAGSNSNMNYTDVVRAIYLYHSQTLGWDDIGYNYLIAQDGSIFDGRDPQMNGDQDNVFGAHFCGKNSNTMGICLLGDYTNILPSVATMISLRELAAWKLEKENLLPSDSSRHPQSNPSSPFLLAMVGHQDGCATACPGDQFYPLLPLLRHDVEQMVLNCQALGWNDFETENFKIYPNPNSGDLFVEGDFSKKPHFEIQDLTGKKIKSGRLNSAQKVDLNDLEQGIYFFLLFQENKVLREKIVLMKN